MLKSYLAPKLVVGVLVLASLSCAVPTSAHAGSDPRGVWINDTGRGAIEIKDCGGALCGHVVWVKDGADTKGCGKQIIGEARHAGGSIWGGGWVYSPEKKRRYDVELTPLSDDKLRVVGYAGIKLFSKTMIWKRAPADLQRCGSTETVAKTEAPAPAPTSDKTAVPPVAAMQAPVAVAPAEAKAPDVKVPDVKSPDVKVPDVKAAESTAPKAPSPDASTTTEKVPAPSTPPAGKAPAKDEEQTAQADEDGNDEPSNSKKLSLGDIDVSKFLKKTHSGNCKLDLPWVKIEFGCE